MFSCADLAVCRKIYRYFYLFKLKKMSALRFYVLRKLGVEHGAEITYPAYDLGVPYRGVDVILKGQENLISKIRLQCGLDDKDWNELLYPCIVNYAKFVHLLPASENHHHKNWGGLFRHSLEVGLWSMMYVQKVYLGTRDLSPQEKMKRDQVWTMAAFVAGICHDLGKPVLDISVVLPTGEEWQPHTMFLTEFIESKYQNRYRIAWRKNRGRSDHEAFSGLAVRQIITPKLWSLLAGESKLRSSDVLSELLKSIIGVDANISNTLSYIVKKADQNSVTKDLAGSSNDAIVKGINASTGLPIDVYVINALSNLMLERKVKINEKGSMAFILRLSDRDVVAVNWNAIFPLILKEASDSGVKSLPNNGQRVLEILSERFVLLAGPNGEYYRRIVPQIISKELPQGLNLVCFDVEMIFRNGVYPAAAEGKELSEEELESINQKQEDIKEETKVVKESLDSSQSKVATSHVPVVEKARDDQVADVEVVYDIGESKEKSDEVVKSRKSVTETQKPNDVIAADKAQESNFREEKSDTRKVFDDIGIGKTPSNLLIRQIGHATVLRHPDAIKMLLKGEQKISDLLAVMQSVGLIDDESVDLKNKEISIIAPRDWFSPENKVSKQQIAQKKIIKAAETEAEAAIETLIREVTNKITDGQIVKEKASGYISAQTVKRAKQAGVSDDELNTNFEFNSGKWYLRKGETSEI